MVTIPLITNKIRRTNYPSIKRITLFLFRIMLALNVFRKRYHCPDINGRVQQPLKRSTQLVPPCCQSYGGCTLNLLCYAQGMGSMMQKESSTEAPGQVRDMRPMRPG